jgi:hypothetical protein
MCFLPSTSLIGAEQNGLYGERVVIHCDSTVLRDVPEIRVNEARLNRRATTERLLDLFLGIAASSD